MCTNGRFFKALDTACVTHQKRVWQPGRVVRTPRPVTIRSQRNPDLETHLEPARWSTPNMQVWTQLAKTLVPAICRNKIKQKNIHVLFQIPLSLLQAELSYSCSPFACGVSAQAAQLRLRYSLDLMLSAPLNTSMDIFARHDALFAFFPGSAQWATADHAVAWCGDMQGKGGKTEGGLLKGWPQ